MGKGDQKSKKGKISIGSYGVRRKRKLTKAQKRAKKLNTLTEKVPVKKSKKSE